MTYNIGTEYHLSAPVAIRAGFSYDTSPVPSETVSPILPDGDRQWFSLGVGYHAPRWRADVGYHLIRFEREKNNSVNPPFPPPTTPNDTANGTYRTLANSLVISLVRSF
jgi:long-chain fatty acid transport protein